MMFTIGFNRDKGNNSIFGELKGCYMDIDTGEYNINVPGLDRLHEIQDFVEKRMKGHYFMIININNYKSIYFDNGNRSENA